MARTLTVSQLNDYIAGIFSHDPILRQVAVRGEVSSWRRVASGHVYFQLVDGQSVVRCVLFRDVGIKQNITDGTEITAAGYVSVYQRDGQYQLYVRSIECRGEGELSRRFELLKARLGAMGYFEQERKKPLPLLPRRVGVVTSSTGAVIEDVKKVAARRMGIPLLLCPSRVQGEGAAEEIARGIRRLDAVEDVDVIIVGRGGGSQEDLWCFNEEAVARAIFECKTPVISAVGHQTDFTIADFVADVRAPTPSAAAELAVPERDKLAREIELYTKRLGRAISRRLDKERSRTELLAMAVTQNGPRLRLQNAWQRLDGLREKLQREGKRQLTGRLTELDQLTLRLQSAGPGAVLRRGYAMALGRAGPVRGATELTEGEKITLIFADGRAEALITGVTKEGEASGG